jgi:hypothetical protein
MKTKYKLVIVAMALVVTGGFIGYYFLPSTPPQSVTQDYQPKKAAPMPPEIKREIEEIEIVAKTDPEEAEQRTDDLIERLPENFQRYLKFGLGGVEDFTFHGIVIDQHGEPVEGALVYNEVGGRYLASGSGFATMKTDAEGRFSISATGANMKVGPIKHPQLAEYRRLDHKGEIGRSAVFWDFQHVEGGNELLWGDYADKHNPFVFKVWRKDANVNANKVYVARQKSGAPFSCDGMTYSIDLTKRLADQLKTGVAEGQLRFRFYCPEKEQVAIKDGMYYDDWTFEIEVVDGGIQETQDVYLHDPPATGYQPLYRLEMNKDAEDYQTRLTKRFYFNSASGRYWGSLEMTIEPFTFRGPYVLFSYEMMDKAPQ